MTEIKRTDQTKRSLQEELLRVRTQADEIEKASGSGEDTQRVVLTLPKSLVHMAEFIAIMETRPMPEALDFWNYVSGIGSDDPMPTRNAKRIMRAWMEEEIMTRTHVAMLELQAEAKDRK
ncbi:hypothetical protein MALG_01494 [Marinovum algicola DG 898]|nr:hypothetical protein MALG_01494 [Marinovum algicola DG 898]